MTIINQKTIFFGATVAVLFSCSPVYHTITLKCSEPESNLIVKDRFRNVIYSGVFKDSITLPAKQGKLAIPTYFFEVQKGGFERQVKPLVYDFNYSKSNKNFYFLRRSLFFNRNGKLWRPVHDTLYFQLTKTNGHD